MIEIIPPEAAGNELLSKLVKVIINLKPVLIHNERLNICHQCQFSGGDFLKTVTFLTDDFKPIVIKRGKVINQEQRTHEVSFAHVERTCKHIHIEVSIELSIHEDDLSFLRGGGLNSGGIVVATHEREQIALATESLGIVVHIRTINANGLKLTFGNALNDKILEQKELIIVGGGVDSINNVGDEIGNTLSVKESLFKLFHADGNRIDNLPVHSVESRLHIGLVLLEFSCLSLFLREGESLGDTHEDVFDGFTVVNHALLQSCIGVVEGGRLNTDSGNTVYQSVDKLVCHGGSTIKHFTHTRNINSGGNFGNLILISKRSIVTNNVKDINSRSIKRRCGNSMCHYISLLCSK